MEKVSFSKKEGGVSGCTYISANGDSLIAAPLSHRYLRKSKMLSSLQKQNDFWLLVFVLIKYQISNCCTKEMLLLHASASSISLHAKAIKLLSKQLYLGK